MGAMSRAHAAMRINFVSVNVGPKYDMVYVSILRDMQGRNACNMDHDCAWWCITDRPDELPEGVGLNAAINGAMAPRQPWRL